MCNAAFGWFVAEAFAKQLYRSRIGGITLLGPLLCSCNSQCGTLCSTRYKFAELEELAACIHDQEGFFILGRRFIKPIKVLELFIQLDGLVPSRTAGLSVHDLRGPENVLVNRTKRSRERFGESLSLFLPGVFAYFFPLELCPVVALFVLRSRYGERRRNRLCRSHPLDAQRATARGASDFTCIAWTDT